MRCILLQDAPQFVEVNPGLFQDGLRQPWAAEHFAGMHRNGHSTATVGVPKLGVRASLRYDGPAQTLERSDEICAGDARETRHQPAR
jgi:hypothetical protein